VQHALISVDTYEQILFFSGMTPLVLPLFLAFIFFSNSENKVNDLGYVGDAIFSQFKAFPLPIFSQNLHSMSYSGITILSSFYLLVIVVFALLLFVSKGEKSI